jgi:hypothetical protein
VAAAAQQRTLPARAVVDPLVLQHVGIGQAQRGATAGQQVGSSGPLRRSAGRGKRQPLPRPRRSRTRPTPHCCTTTPAVARPPAGRQPGVAAAQRGVAGKRQLAARA